MIEDKYLYQDSGSSKLSFVKVFGERNTGTNFVSQLIARNSNLLVLGHSDNRVPEARLKQILKTNSYYLGGSFANFS